MTVDSRFFDLKGVEIDILRINYKNDELGWIPGFQRTHPIYVFRNIAENGHFDIGYFLENFWKSYIGWIRENPRIHPSYDLCDFPSKMTI